MRGSTEESKGWAGAVAAAAIGSTKVGPIPQSFPVPTLFDLAHSIVASAWQEWPVGTNFELRPNLEGS